MTKRIVYCCWLFCALLSCSAISGVYDIVIPCNGCSSWEMQRKAENYATFQGQKIYVADNVSGQFYIREYYVDYVDPDSLALGMRSGVDISFSREHTSSSRLSRNLSGSDAVIRKVIKDMDGSTFPVPGGFFDSAYAAATNVDFEQWLTQMHYRNKLNNFDVLDAEFAKASAEARASVDLGIFSIGTSPKVAKLSFRFDDDTLVTVELGLHQSVQTGAVGMEFKKAQFFDKRGQFIPKSKLLLKNSLNEVAELSELGEPGAVIEHVEIVFNGPVVYVPPGGSYGGGGGNVSMCDITQKDDGLYYVTCY
ncbi:hypothetical protein [Pseudoalteromonas piscicida]|uniref:hypothetical protein n=1 Tax=Pseudoalteromonas piscicida TaxID=43662 RepID=UPI0030B07BC1